LAKVKKRENLENITEKEITIIKRDGREEPFSDEKLNRYLDYLTDSNEHLNAEIIKDVRVKIKKKLKVQDLTKAIITTVASKIDLISGEVWDKVALKAFLLDKLHSTWNIKNNSYPHLQDVLTKGLKYKVYDRDKVSTFSKEEIEELNEYLEPERDLINNTFAAAFLFDKKYCKGLKRKKIELQQHTYMRVAMGLTYNFNKEENGEYGSRLEITKKVYDILSLKLVTLGTPVMNNSLTKLNSYASCVLSTMNNNTWDISNKVATAMLYTKSQGGLAFDVTHIQSKGSYTNAGVKASGLVPYVKLIASAVDSMVQEENRRGAAVITCAFWHYDIMDFLVLKNAAGEEKNTAKSLQYSITTNKWFKEKWKNDEEIYLLCPKDAEDLIGLHGDEWVEKYEELIEKKTVRKQKIRAREIQKEYQDEKIGTGNFYRAFTDNMNPNMLNRSVDSSNLCQEIMLPSRGAKFIKESIVTIDEETFYQTTYKDEEIALCNLGSVNIDILKRNTKYTLPKWATNGYQDVVDILVLVMDNTITIGNYPRAAGKYTNLKYRYLGIGTSNVAYSMAKDQVRMDSEEALIWTYKKFQELSSSILLASSRLAKNFGVPDGFKETKYFKENKIPSDIGNEKIRELFKKYHNYELDEKVRKEIKENGLGNCAVMAIAPTASSATTAGLTESINPIFDYSYYLSGAISTNVIVPEFNKLNKWYVKAFDIQPKQQLMLGAIRQFFIDQGQSLSVWLQQDVVNHLDLAELDIFAEEIGIKTIYYTNTEKNEIKDHCDSCSS